MCHVALFALALLGYRSAVAARVPAGCLLELRQSIVRVTTFDKAGDESNYATGFFVDRDAILTTAGVLQGAYSARVSTDETSFTRVTILKSDRRTDIAILSVGREDGPRLALASGVLIQPGESVYAVGRDSCTGGVIQATRLGSDGVSTLFDISTSVWLGDGLCNGGEPLLDGSGNVIGMISLKDADEGAVSSATVALLLRRPGSPKLLHVAGARTFGGVAVKWLGIGVVIVPLALFGLLLFFIFLIFPLVAGLRWLWEGVKRLLMRVFGRERDR